MLMLGQKEQCLAPADRPSADKPSAAAAAAGSTAAAEEPDDDEELTDAAIAKNIAKLKSMGGSAKSVGKPGAFRKKSSTSKMEVRCPSAARAPGPLAALHRRPVGSRLACSGGPALVASARPEAALTRAAPRACRRRTTTPRRRARRSARGTRASRRRARARARSSSAA